MVVRQFFRCGGYHIGNVCTMTNLPSFSLPRLAPCALCLSARQKSPRLEWCLGTVGALNDAQSPQPHPARCLTAPSCMPDASTSLSFPEGLRLSSAALCPGAKVCPAISCLESQCLPRYFLLWS